jgi:multiple sugar transport system permease protein
MNPTFGLLDYLLGLIGFPPINWIGDPTLALPTVILWDVWEWAPFAFLVLHAGLQSVPAESLDAAKVDGASFLGTMRHISIPLITPYILIIFLFRFVGTFVTFPLIWSITFGGPYYYSSTLSFIAYETAWYFQNIGAGTAYCFIQLITIIAFVSIFLRFFGKYLRGD